MKSLLVGYKCKAIISPCFTPPPLLATFPLPPQACPSMDSHHFQIEEEREHMFEKSLTPSDVGKLNRLVIPKQHAEKYFPLAGESGEKGLLLNFEDESGKEWHFRYSYWTSSQSYVLTKGWSRYVKEKQLDAGDVVTFQRCHHDRHLYIGFRRRGDSLTSLAPSRVAAVPNAMLSWSQFYNTTSLSPPDISINSSVKQDCHLHEGINDSTVAARPLSSNRVRLFGVNLN